MKTASCSSFLSQFILLLLVSCAYSSDETNNADHHPTGRGRWKPPIRTPPRPSPSIPVPTTPTPPHLPPPTPTLPPSSPPPSPHLPPPTPTLPPRSPSPPSRRRPSPPPPPQPIKNDYNLLVLQWPFSYCLNTKTTNMCSKRYKAHSVPSHLTVHGMWPKLHGNREPRLPGYQQPRKFERNMVPSQKLADLKMYWPDLTKEQTTLSLPPYDFWQKEWEKHGYLSELSQIDYFRQAITGAKEIIEVCTHEVKLVPNSNLDLTDIATRLTNNGYPAPQFVRNERAVDGQTIKQLHELRFNFTISNSVYAFHPNVDPTLGDCPPTVLIPGY